MPRYIVRHVGPGTEPQQILEHLRAHPDVTLVDEDIPTMLLVDAPGKALDNLVANAPGWAVSPEQTYAPPGPHRVPGPIKPPASPQKKTRKTKDRENG
jgi:hypothetical protein